MLEFCNFPKKNVLVFWSLHHFLGKKTVKTDLLYWTPDKIFMHLNLCIFTSFIFFGICLTEISFFMWKSILERVYCCWRIKKQWLPLRMLVHVLFLENWRVSAVHQINTNEDMTISIFMHLAFNIIAKWKFEVVSVL